MTPGEALTAIIALEEELIAVARARNAIRFWIYDRKGNPLRTNPVRMLVEPVADGESRRIAGEIAAIIRTTPWPRDLQRCLPYRDKDFPARFRSYLTQARISARYPGYMDPFNGIAALREILRGARGA